MFGYLRPDSTKLTLQQRKIFRDYYCSCCLALERNYGRLARTLLSYDIGYIAMILFPPHMILEPCGKCGKTIADRDACFMQPYWQKISRYQMMLVGMKRMDDIHDSRRSIKSLFLSVGFKLFFQKASREIAPYMHYFSEYIQKEARFSSYAEAEHVYLDFMERPLKEMFSAEPKKIHLLLMLYRWILFIDAVDDYDKDRKKGQLSLLRLDLPGYRDKQTLLREEAGYFKQLFERIHKDILEAYQQCDFNGLQKVSLDNLLYASIPRATEMIFACEKLPHEKILKDKRRLNLWTSSKN